MDSNGNQWDNPQPSASRGQRKPTPSSPSVFYNGDELDDEILNRIREKAYKKSTSSCSASTFASQQPGNEETGKGIPHRRGEQISPMPPLPEGHGTKITNEHLDRIRRMAYAAGKGTSASSSTSGESVFSSLSDASSQDSQVPPPRPTDARASDKYPSTSTPAHAKSQDEVEGQNQPLDQSRGRREASASQAHAKQGSQIPLHEPSKSLRPPSPKPIPQRGQQGQPPSKETQGTGPRVPSSHSGTEDSGKPSNPPQDSSPSTANHAPSNQQAGTPGGIKIKRLPPLSSPNSPPLSQPHHTRGYHQEPSETTGKDSRSKPKTRTVPEAGSKKKASPNPPQPDRFNGSQARDGSHKAKASQHQASFKPAVTGMFQSFVSAVTAPFRWLASLAPLLLAFGWAIAQNLPSLLRCAQMILSLIAAKFGKGTLIEAKDWVSGTAGTIAGYASSGGAYVTDAFGWYRDIPYERLPPVLPLVIHIEVWEPGLNLAVRDVDSLQTLIPDLDLGDVARKKNQMPIDKAKMLKELNSLFVSELTRSLGPSRIVMTELLWKIQHHPVKNLLDSDMKASTSSPESEPETSWLTNWWKPKSRARAELENRLNSALGAFKTSLHDRSSLISKVYGQLASDSILDAEKVVCGMANKLKGQYDFMVQNATESGDDTFRLWLSTHDSQNMAGGQATDEDQIGSSKALAGISNTYSNLKAVCETISLDEELFMEASKQMADEIKFLKKATNSLGTTLKNLEGFSDGQFNADYAGRVETKVLVEMVGTWLDITKAYYGKDSNMYLAADYGDTPVLG
ncbi:uncharacterized protein NECHADRAFT_88683 [Fusarium vanettenii 77-13-4]|uniref:Uncharacterized protein n=1 Tax=Fusarium vanettenii (strain ATCC MYA-4622 / CBS 123669 / FGSC 9596 / NRRL 45880 / 77-13-4) TaxID=660122 RepID=C7ZLI1_FUSV7|nr:uncharacterized protein NECHADRAFT_88683 [Fusarium vanettenii 77-13-4]EEU35140.1 predicted protein [Fusarium vanettenii 77-13-4]